MVAVDAGDGGEVLLVAGANQRHEDGGVMWAVQLLSPRSASLKLERWRGAIIAGFVAFR
jgi:hypothetical protein